MCWRVKSPIIFVLTLLLFGLTSAYSAPGALQKKYEKELVFGVFPYLAPRIIERIYSPIGQAFSEKLNQEVQFLTASSYKKFMRNLDKQMYDIVFVQPFDYVEIADKYGYKPLAVRNEKLPAVLVVAQGSKIKTVGDLRGKTIGLPPKVAAISYLVKRHLRENGLVIGKDVKIKHFRSHFSCMHNVLIESVAACGTAPPAVRVFQSKMKRKLRIFSKTEGISNSLFAVHPRVSKEKVTKLKEMIIDWHNHNQGKKLLKGAKTNSFVEVNDSQYNDVRVMARKFRK